MNIQDFWHNHPEKLTQLAQDFRVARRQSELQGQTFVEMQARDLKLTSAEMSAFRTAIEEEANRQLGADILALYPYPIAKSFELYAKAINDSERHRTLIALIEQVIRYLTLLMLQSYQLLQPISTPEASEAETVDDENKVRLDDKQWVAWTKHNAVLWRLFRKESWTLGQYWEAFSSTMKVVSRGNLPVQLPYSQLTTHFAEKSTNNEFSYLMARRREAAHSDFTLSEEWCSAVIPEIANRLMAELERCFWLTDKVLWQPLQVSNEGVITEALVYQGVKCEAQNFHLQLKSEDIADYKASYSELLLMVGTSPGDYVLFFPMTLTPPATQEIEPHLLSKWQRHTTKGLLPRWSQFHLDGKHITSNQTPAYYQPPPGAKAIDNLQRFLENLDQYAPDAIQTDIENAWKAIRTEQQAHAMLSVRRDAELAALEAWIGNNLNGGYRLLTGPPGQGKSALSARLFEELSEEDVPCVLTMGKSIKDPIRMLQVALLQTYQFRQIPYEARDYSGDTATLRNRLFSQLNELAEDHGRVVWLVDAINETNLLPSDFNQEETEKIFPASLHPGVCVLITSRPGHPVSDAIANYVFKNQQVLEHKLDPFGQADVQSYLEKRLESVWERVLGRYDFSLSRVMEFSQGNPLSLRSGVDLLHRQSEPPGTLIENYQQLRRAFLGPAESILAPYQDRLSRELLNVLALVREPVSGHILLDSMPPSVFTELEALDEDEKNYYVAQALRELRPVLVTNVESMADAITGRYQLFHEMLGDFLKLQMETTQHSYHKRIASALNWEKGVNVLDADFQLRQLPYHFLASLQKPARTQTSPELPHADADEWRALLDVLTNFDFLKDKVEAGLIYDLVSDYYAALDVWPASLGQNRETLKLWQRFLDSEGHRLAEWPQLFFQQALNQADDHLASLSAEAWSKTHQSQHPYLRWENKPQVYEPSTLRRIIGKVDGQIHSLALSRDGSSLYTNGETGELYAWDVIGGVRRMIGKTNASPYSIVLSEDGSTLYSGDFEGEVHAWDVRTGAYHLLGKASGGVYGMVLNRDGTTLYSGDSNAEVRVWNVKTGRHRVLGKTSGWVHGLVLSVDESILYSSDRYGNICAWDVKGNAHYIMGYSPKGVDALVLSRDGGTLYSGDFDGELRAWNVKSGEYRVLGQIKDVIVADLVLSADESILYSGDIEGNLRAWDVKTGAYYTIGKAGWITDLVLSADESILYSGDTSGSICAWDTKARTGRTVEVEEINSLLLNEDATTLYSCDESGNVCEWDTKNAMRRVIGREGKKSEYVIADEAGIRLQSLWHGRIFKCLVLSRNGNILYSGDFEGEVWAWDVKTGTHYMIGKTDKGITSLVLSADGGTMYSGNSIGTLHAWDIKNGVHRVIGEAGEWITRLVLSADGGTLYSGDYKGELRIWNVKTRSYRVIGKADGALYRLVLSADGSTLYSGDYKGELRVWNVKTGICSVLRRANAPVTHIVLSADECTLFYVSRDVCAVDVKTGATLCRTFFARCRLIQLIENHTLACIDGEMNVRQFTLCIPSATKTVEL